jgi:hypothetical protein
MPFLDGIPCSIHGIAFPGHVAALRPVEQLTLHRPGPGDLVYAGCATTYDPPRPVREAMAGAARRVGAVLRHEVGYRGAFGIDGVVTADGFLPTELNPRMGAGLVTMGRALPELPLQLLLDALAGGVELRYRPADLERALVRMADAHRAGATARPVDAIVDACDAEPLAHDPGGGWRRPRPGEAPSGWLTAGPATSGSFVRLVVEAGRFPRGASLAPAAAAFWAFADRELGTGVGELLPAAPAAASR